MSKKIGDILHELWIKDRELYHLLNKEALKKYPLRFNKKGSPTTNSLLKVNKEIVRLYNLYKKGGLVVNSETRYMTWQGFEVQKSLKFNGRRKKS
tara:strand:+ start:193 stop:477 length:285 start_codon:yes stop_codon:yes gene_type:complete